MQYDVLLQQGDIRCNGPFILRKTEAKNEKDAAADVLSWFKPDDRIDWAWTVVHVCPYLTSQQIAEKEIDFCMQRHNAGQGLSGIAHDMLKKHYKTPQCRGVMRGALTDTIKYVLIQAGATFGSFKERRARAALYDKGISDPIQEKLSSELERCDKLVTRIKSKIKTQRKYSDKISARILALNTALSSALMARKAKRTEVSRHEGVSK